MPSVSNRVIVVITEVNVFKISNSRNGIRTSRVQSKCSTRKGIFSLEEDKYGRAMAGHWKKQQEVYFILQLSVETYFGKVISFVNQKIGNAARTQEELKQK